MDSAIFSGITTALLLIIFIGICFWAYSGKRKKAFSEAELLPFDEQEKAAIKNKQGEHDE